MLFPAPVSPTMAIFSPLLIEKDTSCNTVSLPYEKSTFLNSITLPESVSGDKFPVLLNVGSSSNIEKTFFIDEPADLKTS